jgi:hypothetical protein
LSASPAVLVISHSLSLSSPFHDYPWQTHERKTPRPNIFVKSPIASEQLASKCEFRLSDSETDCPSDHRSLAIGIAPARSSDFERVPRGSSGSLEEFALHLAPHCRNLAFGGAKDATTAHESALSLEFPRLGGSSMEANS